MDVLSSTKSFIGPHQHYQQPRGRNRYYCVIDDLQDYTTYCRRVSCLPLVVADTRCRVASAWTFLIYSSLTLPKHAVIGNLDAHTSEMTWVTTTKLQGIATGRTISITQQSFRSNTTVEIIAHIMTSDRCNILYYTSKSVRIFLLGAVKNSLRFAVASLSEQKCLQ